MKRNKKSKAPKKVNLSTKGFFRTLREAEEALKESNNKGYKIMKVKRQNVTWKRYCIGKYI